MNRGWLFETAILALIAATAFTLGLITHNQLKPQQQPETARYCENIDDFPDYVPCKWLKLEQDV